MATKKKKEDVKEVINNLKFSKEDETFKNACESAGIPATKRQASRYRMGKGKAFKSRTKR